MKRKIYKLDLYKPNGDYAGVLDAYNLQVELKTEDFSSISFNVAAYVDEEKNHRIAEILDLHEVVLKLYEKEYSFILRTTPSSFNNEGVKYTYEGLSTQSELDKKLVNGWAGAKREIEFYRYTLKEKEEDWTKPYNFSRITILETGPVSFFSREPLVEEDLNRFSMKLMMGPETTYVYNKGKEVSNFFNIENGILKVYTDEGLTWEIQLGTNILNVVRDIGPYDILLEREIGSTDWTGEKSVSFSTNIETSLEESLEDFLEVYETRLIPLETEGEFDFVKRGAMAASDSKGLLFKRGLYFVEGPGNLTFGGYEFLDLYKKKKDSEDYEPLADKDLEIYYDVFSFVPKGFEGEKEGKLYIADAAEKVDYDTLEFEDVGYRMQKASGSYYTTEGVTLEEILEDNLIPFGWTYEIKDEDIKTKRRSGFEFNNISVYQIIKDVAQSFNIVFMVDTKQRKILFYKEYQDIEGNKINPIILTEGNYLKSIEKSLDTGNLATSIIGIGKDYISTSMISPTGAGWEDYSYYLDEYWDFFKDKNFFDIVNYLEDQSGYENPNLNSRWMPKDMAFNVAGWQRARDLITALLMGLNDDLSLITRSVLGPIFGNEKTDKIVGLIDYQDFLSKEISKEETRYIKYQANYRNYKSLVDNAETRGEDEEDYSDKERFGIQAENYKKQADESAAKIKQLEERYLTNNELFIEVRNYLNNLLEYREELDKFKFDYILQDDTIVDHQDLLEKVIDYAVENAKPKVTLSIDIIDILAAYDIPDEDQKNLVIGNYLYIHFPMFNINERAQIKSMSINFDSNDISLEISNAEKTSKNLLQRMVYGLRDLKIKDLNYVTFKKDLDEINQKKIGNLFERSEEGDFAIGGVETPDLIDKFGIETKNARINYNTETLEIIEDNEEGNGTIKIKNGAIILKNKDLEVITSANKGFEIYQKTKPVFQANKEGLALTNANLKIENEDGSTEIFIGFEEEKPTLQIGNAITGDYLSWVGGTLGIGGEVVANKGKIGGWEIYNQTLFSEQDDTLEEYISETFIIDEEEQTLQIEEELTPEDLSRMSIYITYILNDQPYMINIAPDGRFTGSLYEIKYRLYYLYFDLTIDLENPNLIEVSTNINQYGSLSLKLELKEKPLGSSLILSPIANEGFGFINLSVDRDLKFSVLENGEVIAPGIEIPKGGFIKIDKIDIENNKIEFQHGATVISPNLIKTSVLNVGSGTIRTSNLSDSISIGYSENINQADKKITVTWQTAGNVKLPYDVDITTEIFYTYSSGTKTGSKVHKWKAEQNKSSGSKTFNVSAPFLRKLTKIDYHESTPTSIETKSILEIDTTIVPKESSQELGMGENKWKGIWIDEINGVSVEYILSKLNSI